MRLRPAWAVAALILSSYLGLVVPFHPGLAIEALVILILLAAVAWQGRRRLLEGMRTMPPLVRWGLGLWAASTAWGTVVGLLSGNPLRYVVSQSLAMALLVIAAVAFRGDRSFGAEELATGFAVAAVAALAIHLVGSHIGILSNTSSTEGFRFLLRNNVGVPGAAVMIFVVLLAQALERPKAWRLVLGPVAAGLLLVGGMSRGSWLAAAIGVSTLLILLPRRRRVLLLSLAALLVTLSALGWFATTSIERHSIVLEKRGFEPGHEPSKMARYLELDPRRVFRGRSSLRLGPKRPDTGRLPLAWHLPVHSRLLQLDLWLRGAPRQRLTLSAIFFNRARRIQGTRRVLAIGKGDWNRLRWLIFTPPSANRVRIWASTGSSSDEWYLDDLTIRELPSSWATPIYQVIWRATSAVRNVDQPRRDGGAAYRLAELRSVLHSWSRASLPALISGQGLGATFRFENFTWDARGRRVMASKANYIHNFYVFLAFKLGVAGVAALVGLLLITTWTWSRACRDISEASQRPSSSTPARWLLAAAAASWVAYLVWSVTSPEIYSFHTAPLWGALLAACANEWDRRSS